MSRKIIEHELERTQHYIRIALDPHEGSCHGQHDIIVQASKYPAFGGIDSGVHITYTWGPSVILSAGGTAEFRDALTKALERGEELRKELTDAPTHAA